MVRSALRGLPLTARMLGLCLLAAFVVSCGDDNDPRSILDSDCDPDDRFCDPLTQRLELEVAIPQEVPIRLIATDLEGFETGEEINPSLPAVYFGVDVLRQTLEENNIPTGALRSIELIGVTMEVTDNSLAWELADLDIRIGAAPEDIADNIRLAENYGNAQQAAQTQPVPPGTEGTFEATIVEENLESIGEQLASLGFGFGLKPAFRADAGTPPTGETTLAFTLNLRFTFSAASRD